MTTARKAKADARARTLQVSLGERSYPIEIGYDTLSRAGAEIARHTKATQVAVVTTARVGDRYAGRLLRSLRDAGVRAHRIDVPDRDRAKSLRQLAALYERFVAHGLDRSAAVVALGGGAVGDLAGFAAATYLRGIPFVQVPTTLLSMVDASIGGKVAVNLKQGKNLAGAFHQPCLVWIDAGTLRSLPPRECSAGLAEVIKAAAIWDRGFFAELEKNIERVRQLEPESLLRVLERSCGIKAEVVSRDEREDGLRRLLNFGHTLGHAIEALSGYRKLLHGEAVAIGMVHAARRSEELEIAPPGTRRRLRALIERASLPTEVPPFPRKAYLAALRVDKKRIDARIHYVVLSRIGSAQTLPLTPAEILPPARRRRGVGA